MMKIMKFSWWKLFDQAIYIYLISCRVKSSCWVELLSQASQLDSSSQVQLLNSTQHFFKKISIQLNTFWVEYLTWCNQSRFCIDYQKLNAIIKRNRYSLLLINEMIDKIVDCKHLTWLNIISTFNKLRMHSNSENYTIFIIALKAYKSKMLFFELINDSVSFQQYMNDVLWDFLNDFCQVYLDDILIYSKTQQEHWQHVKMILNHLREADLQVDIQKCKFNVEETVFLKVLVSEQDLCMNFIKVKVIVNWTTSINLKEVQSFVRFVNFYCRFIKDFSKLVKSFTQLTRKNMLFVWNKVCV